MVGQRLAYRFHQAFLMGDRLDDFARLLRHVHRCGYEVISVPTWVERVSGGTAGDARVLILRHDVDTDPPTALRMAELEHDLGMRGSFYFRLRTFDDPIVRRLHDLGMDVGYHFEEIATFAKDHRLWSREALVPHMPAIADRFVANVSALRDRYALPFEIVCSHGDWANRALQLPNHALLADGSVRARAGVTHEVYDALITAPLAARFSDCDRPHLWRPCPPIPAIEAGTTPIKILVHPGQWRVSVPHTLRELGTRVREGCVYATRRWQA